MTAEQPLPWEAELATDIRRPAHGYAHSCRACGKGAMFGFSTPKGTDWFCGVHRHLGRATPPARMPRVGTRA